MAGALTDRMRALASRAKKMASKKEISSAEALSDRFKQKGEKISKKDCETLYQEVVEHQKRKGKKEVSKPKPRQKTSRTYGR